MWGVKCFHSTGVTVAFAVTHTSSKMETLLLAIIITKLHFIDTSFPVHGSIWGLNMFSKLPIAVPAGGRGTVGFPLRAEWSHAACAAVFAFAGVRVCGELGRCC